MAGRSNQQHDRVIGVYGGSFNPPHLGHQLLPTLLLAQGRVDEVWVLPCYAHAFGKALAPFSLRCAWLHAMFAHDPRIRVCGLEASEFERAKRGLYTLEMLERLQARHPDHGFRWVMGQDILSSGETAKWHRFDEIQRRFDPLIVARAGVSDASDLPMLPQISSTQLRQAWPDPAKDTWLSAQLPAAVAKTRLDQARAWPPVAQHTLPERVWVLGLGRAGQSMLTWVQDQGICGHGISVRELMSGGHKDLLAGLKPPDLIWVAARPDQSAAALDRLWQAAKLHAASPVVCSSDGALSPQGQGWKPIGESSLGTLHPIQSLSHPRARLDRAYFGWSGDARVAALLQGWLGPDRLVDLRALDAQARQRYHAACAMAGNYVAAPWSCAVRALETLSVKRPQAQSAMLSLLQSALANLARGGLAHGVSGPLVRGQDHALERHQRCWQDQDLRLHDALVEVMKQALRTHTREVAGPVVGR